MSSRPKPWRARFWKTEPIPRDRHLDHLAERVAATTAAARALTEPLSERQRLWRPDPKTWGVADCFEHLLTVAGQYHPRVWLALSNSSRTPDGVYQPSRFGRWFIHSAGPDGKVKLPAPRVMLPPPPAADAPERFLESQEELLRAIDAGRPLDLQSSVVQSPVSPLLRLSLGEALTMLTVHQQRHLAQARRVTEREDFPEEPEDGDFEVVD